MSGLFPREAVQAGPLTRTHYELQACHAMLLELSKAPGVPFTLQCRVLDLLLAQGVIAQTADEIEGEVVEVPA